MPQLKKIVCTTEKPCVALTASEKLSCLLSSKEMQNY